MYQATGSDLLTYQEIFIPAQNEPLTLLKNMLDLGLFSDYVMYENENETRIAGNALAFVEVNHQSILLNYRGQTSQKEQLSDPLKQVELMLASLPIENWTAYGYVSFDFSRFYYPYSKSINQPLLYFFVPETELYISAKGLHIKSVSSLEKVIEALSINSNSEFTNYSTTRPVVDFTDNEKYKNQVNTLIKAIQSGHLHKAIISRLVKVKGEMDLLGTYFLGSKSNNSARSYCLHIGEVSAVGFSPEIFMKTTANGFVVTNPLAGTRPRGSNAQEDTRLYGELFTDAKEVKEHALSIWLAQSEMSSVCLPETVHVFDFMEVKKYRCVQHLSSRVGGLLQPGKTLWDSMKVLFPGITVSGINKKCALEWIDRLEDEPRGIYAGAIGWVDSSGASDLAIAIRSVYQYGDTIHLNAGAGIVAESIPQNEYTESVNKMNTMLDCLVLKH